GCQARSVPAPSAPAGARRGFCGQHSGDCRDCGGLTDARGSAAVGIGAGRRRRPANCAFTSKRQSGPPACCCSARRPPPCCAWALAREEAPPSDGEYAPVLWAAPPVPGSGTASAEDVLAAMLDPALAENPPERIVVLAPNRTKPHHSAAKLAAAASRGAHVI